MSSIKGSNDYYCNENNSKYHVLKISYMHNLILLKY